MNQSQLLAMLCAALALSINITAIGADAPVKPPTLAEALAQATPEKDELFITVSAEKVKLPKGALPPSPDQTPSQIASAYGEIVQPFGAVTALAPSQITAVYSPPDTPNPYDGMAPEEVMKLLGATFTKDQWKALLSDDGIAYTSLTSDIQRQLFGALFPDGHMVVIQDNPNGPNDPNTKQDLSGLQLTEAHLHLGYIISIALPEAGNPDAHLFSGGPEPPGTPVRYFMMNAQSINVDREYGAQVRQKIPNALKPATLDFSDPAFKRSITLGNIRTVDDVIARIAASLHREIYADPRYGTQQVTVLGAAKTAPVGDLLQTLALCVGGTYRQVGPATVLTNDLVGFGRKHVLWKAFEDKAQEMLKQAPNAPPENNPYTVQDISWGNDPLAFTKEQQDQYWTKWRSAPMPGSMMNITVPFSSLSPAQQETARLTQDENKRGRTRTTLDGSIMIQAEPVLEVLLQSLGGPVLIFGRYQGILPYPTISAADEEANFKRMTAGFPTLPNANAAVQKTPLRPVIEQFPHRAIQIAPKTLQDVTLALGRMPTLGFNELWLQITPSPDQASDKDTIALVTQASKEAKAAGIRLIPDLQIFWWGDEPEPNMADLTLMGQTPLQDAQSHRSPGSESHNTVTPFSIQVQNRLLHLIRQIGAVPDIDGMVWENLIPPGYQTFVPNQGNMIPSNALGYTEAGRLASLRTSHVDPIDLYTNYYTDVRAHLDVPGFNSFNEDRTLFEGWRTLRSQASFTFAQKLAAALPPSFRDKAAHQPVLVLPSNLSWPSGYGSWDDFTLPLPTEDFSVQRGPDGQPIPGSPSIMHINSSLCYHFATVYGSPDIDDKKWGEIADHTIRRTAAQNHDNLVVDITRNPEVLQTLANSELQLLKDANTK